MNTYSMKPNEENAGSHNLLNPSTHENHLNLGEVSNTETRKILDNRYRIIKTIGEGRYAK